jgi:hypothetical protein
MKKKVEPEEIDVDPFSYQAAVKERSPVPCCAGFESRPADLDEELKRCWIH